MGVNQTYGMCTKWKACASQSLLLDKGFGFGESQNRIRVVGRHILCVKITLIDTSSPTVQHLDLCGCRLFVGHCASVESTVSSLGLYYGQPAVEPLFRKAAND